LRAVTANGFVTTARRLRTSLKSPGVAVALGAALLGEPVSPGLLIGGLLIVASVALTTLRPRKAT